jgi:hypothetical protein
VYSELTNPTFQKKYLKDILRVTQDGKIVYGTTLLDFTGPQLRWMLTAMDKEDWRSSGFKLRTTGWMGS